MYACLRFLSRFLGATIKYITFLFLTAQKIYAHTLFLPSIIIFLFLTILTFFFFSRSLSLFPSSCVCACVCSFIRFVIIFLNAFSFRDVIRLLRKSLSLLFLDVGKFLTLKSIIYKITPRERAVIWRITIVVHYLL